MTYTDKETESPDAFVPVPGAEVRSLLIFQLGQRAFALEIESVKQIIPMLKLTPLPNTEPVIEGVANIHGQFIPVIRTRLCFGLEPLPHDLYTPIILAKAGDQVMGLVVDQVSGVASLRPEQIVPAEKVVPGEAEPPQILRGMVHLSGQMVFLIDPALLLDERQARMLREAMAALEGAGSAEGNQPTARPESGSAGEGAEKKRLRREQNGLREPLAQELAELAEACPPTGWQPTGDSPGEPEEE